MIFIDADNFAKLAREKAISIALQYNLELTLVANHHMEYQTMVKFLIADQTKDSADKLILNLLKPDDLLLSRDLPLCKEALDKGAKTMNDYGEIFNSNLIRTKLIERKINLNLALADNKFRGKESNYSLDKLAKFEKNFKSIVKTS